MRTSLALLCVLAAASVAAADPVTLVAVNDGTPTGYTGLTRYLIYVDAAEGYASKGLDGRFDGPMHQCALVGTFPPPNFLTGTPDLTYGSIIDYYLPAGAGAADSHLFSKKNENGPNPEDAVYAGYAIEDISYTDLAHAPAEGIGLWLAGDNPPTPTDPGNPAVDGKFAIAWPNTNTNHLLVAQIVIPDGEQVVYTGDLAYQLVGAGGEVKNLQLSGVTLVIPEPATLGLLAVGGLGALIRKRR